MQRLSKWGGNRLNSSSGRAGSIAIVLSVMLVTMLALGGLAISLAQIQLARVETQIVADCSSLSGANLFGERHEGDLNTPELMAGGMPERNTIMGRTARVNRGDIEIGRATVDNVGRQTFRSDRISPNAVKVTMRIGQGGAMSDQPLFFPFLMGVRSFGVERTSISAKLAHDVVLVMDRSGSMNLNLRGNEFPFDRRLQKTNAHPHPSLSRWGIMVRSTDPLFAGFAKSKIEEKFALVTFGSDITIGFEGRIIRYNAADRDVELTDDTKLITRRLLTMWDDRPLVGATQINAGIEQGAEVLLGNPERDFAFKSMVLLTDGEQFPSSRLHIEAARRAAARGITIHAIAFSGGAKFDDMLEIARIGGGKAFLAPDEGSLVAAFEEIATMAPVAIIQ